MLSSSTAALGRCCSRASTKNMAEDVEDESFDFDRLRKCLREEYAFVGQQKRSLQTQYASIVSTGDSVYRSLWINGQQWRNLVRLKGGPKFSSECVYTANLLDAITFVDGHVWVGFKETYYGNFLKELKENTALVKSVLIVADELGLETSAFVRTILTSLYGSCLFPADQTAVVTIVKSIIEYHLVFSPSPHAIFARERNSFSNILQVLMQSLAPIRAFLVSACKDVILSIILDGSMFWTLEEQELLSVMDVSEVRLKFGDPGSEGTTERIRTHMVQCWSNLKITISTLLNKVKDSLDCMPKIFLWIVTYFYRFSQIRGFSVVQAKVMVMRFLFHQVIVPSLLKPQPLLIDTEIRASQVAVFNLKKVSSILETIISLEAGDTSLDLSPEAEKFYENLEREPLHDVVNHLLKRIPNDGDFSSPEASNMPGITRTSVLITKSDLDSLVKLLHKLRFLNSVSKPAEGNHQTERLIDQASLEHVLNKLARMYADLSTDMAKLTVSGQDINLKNELQNILQAFNKPLNGSEEVLVISLGLQAGDCPGMLSEEKVLGFPTPKPRRKAVAQPTETDTDKSLDSSQLYDSDSLESSSDEKAPEVDQKTDNIEVADDVLASICGFENNFVDLPPQDLSSQPTQVEKSQLFDDMELFSGFDSILTPPEHKDSSLSVVLTAQPSVQPTASSPPGKPNNSGLLIDFSDAPDSSPAVSELSQQPVSPISGTLVNGALNSSGSQSSSSSAKRSSSSASSASDGALSNSRLLVQAEASLVSGPDKKDEINVVRRKSLKENLQIVLNKPLMGSPKREKKKKPKVGPFRKRHWKKTRDVIYDSANVPTILATGGNREKTAKDICDEIIHKYATIKRARSVSSLDKPNKEKSNRLAEVTLPASRDDEVLMADAKCKLRLVLSSGSGPVFPFTSNASTSNMKRENCGEALLAYLRKDLCDAMATQDCAMVARLHETLSTLEKLPSSRYFQLLKELQNDYRLRKPYITYLIRSQQGLMATRKYLGKMLERVESDREICRRYLMTQCVGMYLNKRKDTLGWFIRKFNQLKMSDEKSHETMSFLQYLKEEFQKDSLWLGSNDKQRSEAVGALERYVIGRVYWNAVYAFGEGDKSRDDLFHERVESMCKSVGEDFSVLDIKEEYQHEAPWFPAQYELLTLTAYKTPSDKLKCIQRCCTTIMSLLAMSSGSDAVGADAFTPVLIYVVMHANPRGLLTTVDFINSYLSEPLTGEQYYCWMQFCSAIQFIKILIQENLSKST